MIFNSITIKQPNPFKFIAIVHDINPVNIASTRVNDMNEMADEKMILLNNIA